MKIEIIKSHDMWEEDCSGWYDLYKVDDHYFYPLSDWWDNDKIPDDLYVKFTETINGSKTTFDDIIKSLYWDLVLTSNDVDSDFDTWCYYTENSVNWMLKRMNQKFGISIDVVDHGKRYSDMLAFQERFRQKE